MEAEPQKHYHMVGVAGVGMSALAQVLLAHGYAVTGSDRFLDEGRDLDVFHKLRSAGVDLLPQDGTGVQSHTAAAIVSTAIEEDNPDVTEARKHSIPIIHRTDMLAFLACGHRFIAVTGTSGKTTVAGMLGWIFECVGRDPTVVNGGSVLNWQTQYRIGNVRIGRSNLWIVEVDESDKSLLRFEPDWVVVTNITKDHFELSEVTELFRLFARRVRMGVVCGPGVAAILQAGGANELKPSVALVEEPFEPYEEGGIYGFWYKGYSFRSPLLGRHNAANAFVAVVLCDRLGLDLAAVRNALMSFKGIERRMEQIGTVRGVAVVDDYAHNPAKIAAAWETVAALHRRVIGVWRPHGHGPVALMEKDLEETFATVCRADDRLILLPVFYAGGTLKKKASIEDLAKALKDRGINAEAVENYELLLGRLPRECESGDCVLCMGARDPYLPVFARQMLSALEAV